MASYHSEGQLPRTKTLKALVIALICALTLYPLAELTRVIVVYDFRLGTIFEICIMWVLYLVAMVTLTRVVKV
jgi:hypothetical protein